MSYTITISELSTDPRDKLAATDNHDPVERVIYSQLVEENPLKAVITAVNAHRRRKRTVTAKKDD